jgi:hydrophobic/amphiphilic exporter-1 (mainly G- bacteria), HAE1 family
MNITALFIRRPVMTTLVTVALLFFGVLAYRQLPVSDLPTVDYPTITVSASLPGTSPETMASSVATPLEKQFSTIAGISQMTSSSTLGQTTIVLQFDLSRDVDAAAQDVNAAIAQTLRQLPTGITPPSYQKVNPAASPILYFALTSDQLSLSAVDEYAETFLGQRLSMVPGVAQVAVFGSQKYAVRIQLDPDALAQRGIGIDEVAAAVQSHNVNQPTGTLWGPDRTYTLQASGQLANAAQFRRVVVTYRNGAPVRLGELGNVLDDVQNNKAAAWFDGTRGVILAIQRQPGTNTVAVAQAVKATVAELAPQLPPSVQLRTMADRSQSIDAEVSDVKFTLLLTLVLVVLVIFLFLRNLSATVVPSLVLPLAVVGTFAGMYTLGFTLDNLSLMALTLAVGFVVDDAVVMLENIVRHLEMGKDRMTAALDGAREVGFTILSMTLSLVAVFIPLLFMPGVVGRLFHEFAVTIALAILISGVVSLSLTPMLGSRVLHAPSGKTHGRAYRAIEHAFDATLGAYERSLRWAMARRPLTLALSAAVLIGTVVLFIVVPKGFIPTEDTGQITGNTLAGQGASFDAMVRYHEQIVRVLARDTNIAGYMTSIGTGGSRTTNQGTVLITLKPLGKRAAAQQVIDELQPKLAAIPGVQVALQMPPAIQMGGRQSASTYQFQLQSANTDTLYAAAQRLADRMSQLDGLQNVVSDLQLAGPQVSIEIDRDRAAAMGVAPDVIERALYDAYGSGQVSTIYTSNNQYWVVMELEPQFQQDLSALNRLYVSSGSGTLVPLSWVAVLGPSVGPMSVNHAGQVPAVTISFNTAPGVSLSQAQAQIQALARQVLPPGVTTAFAGNAQAFQGIMGSMLFLVVIAVFVIYLVLGILYESFVHPVTILTGLPFAMFGGVLALYLFRMPLDVYGFVAIILLLGIVKKNAIMMIDFAIAAERDGHKSPAESIVEAATVRFRPIMMTTFAALMAALPIALGSGAGSESRRPLGVAVVGGLAFSQLVTLYVTPVFYTYLDELPHWLGERWRRVSARWGPRSSPDDAHDAGAVV